LYLFCTGAAALWAACSCFNPDALSAYPLPIFIMSENNNKFTEPIDETATTDYTRKPDERKNLAPISQLLNYLDIADINVGFIATVKSKTIEKILPLNEYLLDIKSGIYKEVVAHYRTSISDKMPVELKSDDVRNRKSSTPCCIPHSNCATLAISNKLPQNGFMQIDVDCPSLGNLYVSDEQIKAAFDACPYILAYHQSIGGDGYVGYAYTTDAIDKSFWGVAEDLQKRDLYCVGIKKVPS